MENESRQAAQQLARRLPFLYTGFSAQEVGRTGSRMARIVTPQKVPLPSWPGQLSLGLYFFTYSDFQFFT
jgi:hypothetical protein